MSPCFAVTHISPYIRVTLLIGWVVHQRASRKLQFTGELWWPIKVVSAITVYLTPSCDSTQVVTGLFCTPCEQNQIGHTVHAVTTSCSCLWVTIVGFCTAVYVFVNLHTFCTPWRSDKERAVKLYNPGPRLMQLTCYSGLEEAQLLR